jgi:hypothetical protein
MRVCDDINISLKDISFNNQIWQIRPTNKELQLQETICTQRTPLPYLKYIKQQTAQSAKHVRDRTLKQSILVILGFDTFDFW